MNKADWSMLLRLAFGLAISAALGIVVGGGVYWLFGSTRAAWIVGGLLALGGASKYVEAYFAAYRDAEAIIEHLKKAARK
jgi:hypothetical protein